MSASGSEQSGPQQLFSGKCRRSAVYQWPLEKRQLALVSPALTRPTNTSETRWQKANTVTSLTEIKAIWQHLNPILLYQHVLDTPSHQ